MAVCIVVCMIVGYLFGCIQTGYIVGRVNKIDIRDYGSGNSGTTNTLRTLGKTAAIITFLGDAVKGLVAVNLARYVNMYSLIQLDFERKPESKKISSVTV